MTARKAWAVVVVFGAILGFDAASAVISDQRDRERAREICGIIRLIDDRNQKVTPTTDDQRHFIIELHKYRLRLDC